MCKEILLNKRNRNWLQFFLFAVCVCWMGIRTGKMEAQAADSETKLYMDYLKAENKRMRKSSSEFYYIPYKDTLDLDGYKIIDLNKDGTKELLYCGWEGGMKPHGFLCSIQNGTIRQAGAFTSPTFYVIKGSNAKIAVEESEAAGSIRNFTVYTLSSGKLKKNSSYSMIYGESEKVKRFLKDSRDISKKKFQAFQKKLKKIKLKEYHPDQEKTKSNRSEKEIYLDYLAKVEKKMRKKILQQDPDVSKYVLDHIVGYKIIDFNSDGKKELIYVKSYVAQQAYICTIKNGNVRKLWKSEEFHAIFPCTLKGSASKVVMEEAVAVGTNYEVLKVSPDKVKKEAFYHFGPDFSKVDIDYVYKDIDGKIVADPFGKEDNRLQHIEMEYYKRSASGK